MLLLERGLSGSFNWYDVIKSGIDVDLIQASRTALL